ncbi:hypothetical protein OHA25_40630 [Nonomuraea sp. NBC_00507]|uniref:hypothetical protein n=1 Tax=Nonomuraea sp. NBC_00507 TaxID=2976002 RepID=UPI002E182B3F
MQDELRIVVPGCSDHPEQTQKALADILAKYGASLLEEADRVATPLHTGPGKVMITSAMITDMDLWMRKGYVRPRKSSKEKAIAGVGLLAVYLGGLFTNNITVAWGAVGFAVCALLFFWTHFWGSES